MMDEAAKKNQMHTSEGNLSLRPDLMMDGARIICKNKQKNSIAFTPLSTSTMT